MEEQLRQVLVRLAVIETTAQKFDADVTKELATIRSKLDSIQHMIGQDFIRKDYFKAVFDPVRNIVYGMVGLILSAVMAAILYLVIK